MKVTKIILNNIKSYVYEEIDFTEGINCILGLNGSGKSTIIESIGLALFNFNKGSLNQLLRYNENKGSIEVIFIANDDREYKVVRTIRTKGSTVRIIDLQTNSELYDNVSDVYSFIKKVLKVKKAKEFSKMFEAIIAVPQGQYVNAFLEKSAARKENFDKLFDLHIYKETANKVKDIIDNFKKNQIKTLETDIALINGQVITIDSKKASVIKLDNELEDLKADKLKLEKRLGILKTKKAKLEAAKIKLEELNTGEVLANAKWDNINALIKQATEELTNANNANEVVKQNLSYYLHYEEKAKSINELEAKYNFYLHREKRLVELKNNLTIITNDIVNLKEKLQEKAIEKENKNKQEKTLSTQVFAKQINVDELNKKYLEKNRVNEAKLTKINESIEVEKKIIYELENYLNRHNDIVTFDIKTYNKNLELISEIEKNLQALKLRVEKINALEKEYNLLSAEYDSHKENTTLTIDGTCPILKEKCMNIGNQSLSNYFADKMVEIDNKIQIVIAQIKQEKIDLPKENDLLATLQDYNNYQQLYLNSVERQKVLANEFNEKFKLELNKEVVNKTIKQHSNKILELQTSLQQEDVKKRQLINDFIEINSINVKIKSDYEIIKANEVDIKNIEKQEEGINTKIEEKQALQIKVQKDINNLSLELIKDQDIKDQLAKSKNEIDSLSEYRDKYLANIEKAKETTKLEKSIKEYNQDKNKLNIAMQEIQAAISKLRSDYSIDILNETIDQFISTNQEIRARETSIKERTRVREELFVEIEEMEVLIKARDKQINELNKINKIVSFLTSMRAIYTNLPLKLSQTYREYIALLSTNLYRQIADESVRLEILEDYEVRIVDDEEKSSYKTMEQLSGGEQMSVALAIRLSMLKHLAGIDIYFLDEPTINLDVERRQRIGEVILDVSQELSQLFVISHDDTFDSITDRVIKIEKNNNSSRLV